MGNGLLRVLYSLLFYCLLPGVWLRLLWRSIKEPLYRQDFFHRMGFVPVKNRPQPVVWVHAVSAGETIASAPLVERLLSHKVSIVMTNMTATGRDRVDALLDGRVDNYYAPYDVPGSVQRFIDRVQPKVLVIIDTELWPNMIHYCHKQGVKVVLVNARLSEKSFRGYQSISGIAGPMMAHVDFIASQTQAQGDRFIELGLDPKKLLVFGSIKFDIGPPENLESKANELRAELGDRPTFIAASTHRGEESLVLGVFIELRRQFPELLLVIAPRHTHRTPEIIAMISDAGLSFCLRSGDAPSKADVFLLDTMGELSYFYVASDVAFVGGSFAEIGGHNFLEAVVAKVPVVMGPHLSSIEDIVAQFVDQKALCLVDSKEQFTSTVHQLLSQDEYRDAMVQRASDVHKHNAGALESTLDLVLAQLD
jgi:3-deoxy-D-manno-octulosonic-acid transferase